MAALGDHVEASDVAAQVVGWVIFTRNITYSTFDEWKVDSNLHCVDESSPYAYQKGDTFGPALIIALHVRQQCKVLLSAVVCIHICRRYGLRLWMGSGQQTPIAVTSAPARHESHQEVPVPDACSSRASGLKAAHRPPVLLVAGLDSACWWGQMSPCA